MFQVRVMVRRVNWKRDVVGVVTTLVVLGLLAGRAAAAAGGQLTVLDGAYSKAQAERGGQTFKQVCAACHNIDEMSGNRFRSSWADQSLGDLFDFVTNAMPQGDPGSLTAEEYASVIAFFLSQSGYPAGSADLPASKDDLSKLKVLAVPK